MTLTERYPKWIWPNSSCHEISSIVWHERNQKSTLTPIPTFCPNKTGVIDSFQSSIDTRNLPLRARDGDQQHPKKKKRHESSEHYWRHCVPSQPSQSDQQALHYVDPGTAQFSTGLLHLQCPLSCNKQSPR